MSKEQLIAELEKLTPTERWELFEHFWPPGLQGPTEEEKALLDREIEDYERNPEPGEPGLKGTTSRFFAFSMRNAITRGIFAARASDRGTGGGWIRSR
jgi:hypothetical protein